MVPIGPNNARDRDGNNLDNDIYKTNFCRNGDITNKNDAHVKGELPLLHKAKEVGTSSPTKILFQWEGYGPNVDTVEPLQHKPEHFNVILGNQLDGLEA